MVFGNFKRVDIMSLQSLNSFRMLRHWAQVPSVPVGTPLRKNGQSTLGRAPVRCLASKGKKDASLDESMSNSCRIIANGCANFGLSGKTLVQSHMMRFHVYL